MAHKQDISEDEIQSLLDELADAKDGLEAAEFSHKEFIKTLIPSEIQAKILDAEDRHKSLVELATSHIEELTRKIQVSTLNKGGSIKGAYLSAIYNPGRITWNSAGLEGYAIAHPEILAFKRIGDPFVTLKRH